MKRKGLSLIEFLVKEVFGGRRDLGGPFSEPRMVVAYVEGDEASHGKQDGGFFWSQTIGWSGYQVECRNFKKSFCCHGRG